jgi:hypothetical protein
MVTYIHWRQPLGAVVWEAIQVGSDARDKVMSMSGHSFVSLSHLVYWKTLILSKKRPKQGLAYFEFDESFLNVNSQKRLVASSDNHTIPGHWIIDEFQFPAMIIPLTDHPPGILHIS